MRASLSSQSDINLITFEKKKKARTNNQVFFSAAFLSSKSAHVRSSASILRRSISDSVERNISRRIGIHQASKEGLVDMVKKILEQDASTIDDLDDSGYAPLHYASRYERKQIADLLIEHGADINVCTSDELRLATPLHQAARFNAYSIVRMLIERKAALDQRSQFGQHALHYAARRGSAELIKLFLEQGGVDPQVVDNERSTPLHVASQSGRLDIVELLLRYGVDPTHEDMEGCTAMHHAAKEGRADILRVLLKTASTMGTSYTDILDTDGQYTHSCLHHAVRFKHLECNDFTPLHMACINGDYDMVVLLVKRGALLEAVDTEGMTPILRASLEGHVDIIDYLLNQGVNISPVSGQKSPSPLLCAVKRGHYKAVTHLLRRGSPIHLRDTSDRTALHIAVYSADAQTVTALLEHGGKSLLETRDRQGRTPMHYAAAKGDLQIINLLLEAGSGVDYKDEEERVPLHCAAENGNLCSVEALVNRYPTAIDESDSHLSTPLTYAAAGGYVDVVKYLLNKGADVESRDYDRITPLLHVSKMGCHKTALVLLDYGADINATDKNRYTALTSAAANGHADSVTLFLDRDADMSITSSDGENCLTAAAGAGHGDVCMAIVKHHRWEEAFALDGAKSSLPLKCLIEKFPDVTKVVMDKCITKSEHPENDEHYQITYSYKYLDPPPEQKLTLVGKKFFAPKAMLQNERSELLFHPLILELIRYKWSTFGLRFFYVAAFIHLIFLVTITFYVQCQKDLYSFKFYNYNSSGALILEQLEVPLTCTTEWMYACEFVILVISIFNLCIEVYQMYTERWDYIDTSNVVELSTFSVAMLTLGIKYTSGVTTEYWIGSVIVVLLAYLTMLLQFQSLFQTGIYVTMLFEVLKTLLRVVFVFVMLFIAYAIVFHLLLSRRSNLMYHGLPPESNDKDPFADFLSSILKVMVMTIGEIEYTRFFVDESLAMPTLSRMVFLSFCIFLPIVLMNLTIGLAVGDIETIQKSAELKRLAIQIDSIYEFEEKLPCWLYRRFYKSETIKRPNEKPRTISQKIKGRLSNRLLNTAEKVPDEMSNPEYWSEIGRQLSFKMDVQEDRIHLLSSELKQQRNLLEKIMYSVNGTSYATDESSVSL